MRAVVVYESMYGNTHLIADAIGSGLRQGFDVTVVPVAQADPVAVQDADLVVAGGPTHAHGMSRASTRQSAAQQAQHEGSGLTLEPGALAEGVREWAGSLGAAGAHGKAAVFDTRLDAPVPLTGRASKGLGKALRRHGYDLVTEPESFLVTKQNRLVPDEEERARTWGASLAAIASPAVGPADGS